MASSIQVKRGTTAKVAAYTPLSGELVLDTTTNKLYAGDGTTAGGNQIVGSRKGVTDASNATTGEVGEFLTATSAAVVSLTSGSPANLGSITLSAGDWDVSCVIEMQPTSATLAQMQAALTTTSATLSAFPDRYQLVASTAANVDFVTPTLRVNVSASTTVYAVGQTVFTSGTCAGRAFIRARRIR